MWIDGRRYRAVRGGFGGIVVRDRFSAYNHLPTQQRQLCWVHLIRDLTAIAERPSASSEFGAELLGLQQQLFDHWHRYMHGTIDWPALRQHCRRSARPLRRGCSRWWSWATSGASERRGPRRCAPLSRRCSWPLDLSGGPVESSSPRTPLSVPCASR